MRRRRLEPASAVGAARRGGRDHLLDVADDEARGGRVGGAVTLRVRVAHDEDLAGPLEGHEVRGEPQRSGGAVIPVFVGMPDRIGRCDQRRGPGGELVGGLRDHGREHAGRLVAKERDPDREGSSASNLDRGRAPSNRLLYRSRFHSLLETKDRSNPRPARKPVRSGDGESRPQL